jgi:hypothetical protein
LIVLFASAYRLVFGVVLFLNVPGEVYRLLSAAFMVVLFLMLRGSRADFARGIRWS